MLTLWIALLTSGCGRDTYSCGSGASVGGNKTSVGEGILNPLCTVANCYLVVLGDSRSAPGGIAPYPTTTQIWPYVLSQSSYFANHATLENLAISGATCSSMGTQVSNAIANYSPNGTTVLQSIATIMIGRNDLSESVSTIQSCIDSAISTLKSNNFTVVLMTVYPSSTQDPQLPSTYTTVSTMSTAYTSGRQYFTFGGTGFSFTTGQYVYIQSLPAITTTPTCSVTSYAQSGLTATVGLNSCTGGTFSSGQALWFTNVTSSAAFLNMSPYFAVTSATPSQVIFPVGGIGTAPTASVTGSVSQLSPNIPIYNGSVGEVQSGSTSTSVTLAMNGVVGSMNFSTISLNPAARGYVVNFGATWDATTPGQDATRVALNQALLADMNPSYPTFDDSCLLPNPNLVDPAMVGTVDGTHGNPVFNAALAASLQNYFQNTGKQ